MAIITEQTGDIFAAPAHSILIHACNARGSWGAGVAASFKYHYPHAYKIYHEQCINLSDGVTLREYQDQLVGSCLLIPPQAEAAVSGTEIDSALSDEAGGNVGQVGEVGDGEVKATHWIACLFTSHGYGKNVSPPDVILRNTELAVSDLARQIEAVRAEGSVGEEGRIISECWAVRINCGFFGVPWERTKEVLQRADVRMVVVRPKGDDGEAELKGGRERGRSGRGSERS